MCSRTVHDGDRRPSGAVASDPLRDPQGRRLDTLRLAITDRCNLRCRYCMPEDGIRLVDHHDVLSFEEMHRLAAILCDLGVQRIRVTGGEPLVRRGSVSFLRDLAGLPTRPEILLTTNGVLLRERLDDVRRAGVRRINLSLDSLDCGTFQRITRRDALDDVLPLIDEIPAAGLGLKINVVVQPGVNDAEIPDFARLTRDRDLVVRFIEPMPFDGNGGEKLSPFDGDRIAARLAEAGAFERSPDRAGVADMYAVDGWRGAVGVIRGSTRTFCGACSRLRIDARGGLRTCLYGAAEVDLRGLIRGGAADDVVAAAIRNAVGRRHVDGHAAERARDGERCDSMSSIGG